MRLILTPELTFLIEKLIKISEKIKTPHQKFTSQYAYRHIRVIFQFSGPL